MNHKKNRMKSGMEKKLLMLYHKDGIMELAVGIVLAAFGFISISGESGLIGLLVIPSVLVLPLKQRITYPRLGMIRFDSRKRKSMLKLVFGFVLFLGLGIFYMKESALPVQVINLIDENMLLIYSFVLGFILFSVGYFLHHSRFYFYALLEIGLVWGAYFLGLDHGYAILGLGGLISGMGALCLIRFIRAYPVVKESESEDETE